MIDPEFPEPESSATDIRYRLHVDDITRRKANETRTRLGVTGRGRPADVARCDTLTHEENKALDIQTIQRDRATMPGYRLVTFDEMEIDPPAKRWLIKGVLLAESRRLGLGHPDP